MDNKTVVAGVVGAIAGGLIGFGAGRFVERREKSIERGLATELLSIFGGIAGGVMTAALVNAINGGPPSPSPQPVATLPQTPAAGSSTPSTGG